MTPDLCILKVSFLARQKKTNNKFKFSAKKMLLDLPTSGCVTKSTNDFVIQC